MMMSRFASCGSYDGNDNYGIGIGGYVFDSMVADFDQ